MKRTNKWSFLAHLFSLPWTLLLLLWPLAIVKSLGDVLAGPIFIAHNFFIHEWYGRFTLSVSIVFLVLGFIKGTRKHAHIAAMIIYALVLALFAGYTIWWGVTGQEYEWP